MTMIGMVVFAVAATAAGDVALALACCFAVLIGLVAIQLGIRMGDSGLAALREFEETGDESKLPWSLRRRMRVWRNLHPDERPPWEGPDHSA